MQLYAPSTLAPARDFWLLRYTSAMEDGSLVVCERSLTNTQNGPSMPPVQNFVRAEMLPSAYLIRPCDGCGSIIHIVDYMNLEAWSVPEVLRPLYESSTVLAQKTTMTALRQLRQIAQEASQSCAVNWGQRPVALRDLSQRLNRMCLLHYSLGFSESTGRTGQTLILMHTLPQLSKLVLVAYQDLELGIMGVLVQFTRANRLMCYGQDKMVRFRDNWAGFLYNRFLKGKLLNM